MSKNKSLTLIDVKSIKVTQANYPDTIQLGSIIDIKGRHLPTIDLLIGGSPCQGFSINGERLNFDDERSKLFFEFVRLKNFLRPKYWLLENVATMSKEVKTVIDREMGVNGVYMNSNAFSAQNRKRLYWTNIPFLPIQDPSDCIVADVLESVVDEKHNLRQALLDRLSFGQTETDGVITLNPKKPDGTQTYQQDRIYHHTGKFPALTATLGNRFNIIDKDGRYRRLTIREQARLQTIPDEYSFKAISDADASKCIGNGFTIDAIVHIIKNIGK